MNKTTTIKNRKALVLLMMTLFFVSILLMSVFSLSDTFKENKAVADGEVLIEASSTYPRDHMFDTYTENAQLRNIVSTAADFLHMFNEMNNTNDKYYELRSDFIIEGNENITHALYTLNNHIIGNGHRIMLRGDMSFTAYDTNGSPLFDKIENGSISDLVFINNSVISISSNENMSFGSFCGENRGTLENVKLYNNANIAVSGTNSKIIGGLIGKQEGNIISSELTNNGSIESTSQQAADHSNGDRLFGGIFATVNATNITSSKINSTGSLSYTLPDKSAVGAIEVGAFAAQASALTISSTDINISGSATALLSMVGENKSTGNCTHVAAGGLVAVMTGNITLEKNILNLNSKAIANGAGSNYAAGYIGHRTDGTFTLRDNQFGITPVLGSAVNITDDEAVSAEYALVHNGFSSANITIGGNNWLQTRSTPNKDYAYAKSDINSNIANNINYLQIIGGGTVATYIDKETGIISFAPYVFDYMPSYESGATPFYNWYDGTTNFSSSQEPTPISGLQTDTAYNKYMNSDGKFIHGNMPIYSSSTTSKGLTVIAYHMYTEISTQWQLSQFSKDIANGVNHEWMGVKLNASDNWTFTKGIDPIGSESNPYKGTFDGNNVTITFNSNAIIDGANNVGLFGVNAGTITNVNIVFGGSIVLQSEYFAANAVNEYNAAVLCAVNKATISNCSVSVSAGATIGYNQSIRPTVEGNLFNLGALIGKNESAGVIGAAVTNCTVQNVAIMGIGNSSSFAITTRMGGAIGYIASGHVNGLAVKFEGAMTTTTDENLTQYYMGGFAGVISDGVALDTIGVSIGNKILSTRNISTFNPQAFETLSLKNISVNNTRVGFFAGSLGTGNRSNLWVARHDDEDNKTAYLQVDKNRTYNTIGLVGTINGSSSGIKTVYVKAPEINRTTINSELRILRNHCVLSVELGENKSLIFTRPEIESAVFTGWFRDKDYTSSATDTLTPYFTVNAAYGFDLVFTEIISNRINDEADYLNIVNKIKNGLNSFSGVEFQLTADLKFENDNTYELSPLGISQTKPFNGMFNGNGHSITINGKLFKYDNDTNYLGLFGYIGPDGGVHSLTVNYNNIDYNTNDSSSYSRYFGGIAGYNSGKIGANESNKEVKVEFNNCNINYFSIIAGVCALNASSLGDSNTGVYNTVVTLNNSRFASAGLNFTTGGVTQNRSYAAGGIGWNRTGLINGILVKSDSNSSISATATNYAYAGGVIGFNSSNADTIVADFAGNIKATGNVAMFGGAFGAKIESEEAIVNRAFFVDYSNGAIKGDGHSSQFATANVISIYYGNLANANNLGSIETSLNGGRITFTAVEKDVSTKPFDSWRAVTQDKEYLSLLPNQGVNGKTFTPNSNFELKNNHIYLYFVKTSINDFTDLNNLSIDVNSGYSPYVRYTIENSIAIATAFNPIGTEENPFSGEISGANNTISINGGAASFRGLFGYIGEGSSISNLKIDTNIVITNENGSIGLLAIHNEGKISNVEVTIKNSISAGGFFGGVVATNNGTMLKCVVTQEAGIISIASMSNVEGAIGYIAAINNGTIGELGTELYGIKVSIKENAGVNLSYTTTLRGSTIGGIVGNNNGDVKSAQMTLEGYLQSTGALRIHIGGLIGKNSGTVERIKYLSGAKSSIYSTYSGATVDDKSNVGGLIAINRGKVTKVDMTSNGVIGHTNSNIINLEEASYYAGGVFGILESIGSISDSTFNINSRVYAYSNAGGLAAFAEKTLNNTSSISNIKVTVNGAISAKALAGGLIAENHSTIKGVILYVNNAISASLTDSIAGGLIGEIKRDAEAGTIIENVFIYLNGAIDAAYKGSVAGKSVVNCGKNVWVVLRNDIILDTVYGGTLADFNALKIIGDQAVNMNVNESFNTVSFSANESNVYNWYSDVSGGASITPSHGTLVGKRMFTPNNSLINRTFHISFIKLDISNVDELFEIARSINASDVFYGVRIRLSNDIEFNSASNPFNAMGTKDNPFNGTFDGAYYTIRFKTGSSISSLEYAGLFGYISDIAVVRNLKLDIEQGVGMSAVVGTTANPQYFGTFAGYSAGYLENIIVNAKSVPYGQSGEAYKLGGFAGLMEQTSLKDASGSPLDNSNVWIVNYNESIATTSNSASESMNNELKGSNVFGVNKLNVLGSGDVNIRFDTNISQNQLIRITVDNMDYNTNFYKWMIDAQNNIALTTEHGYGTVNSSISSTLLFDPLKSMKNHMITLSFINLEISDAADLSSFVANVNTYSGFVNTRFVLTNDIHIDGLETKVNDQAYNQFTPIGSLAEQRTFDGIFDGQNNKLTFTNMTFVGTYASIFSNVGSEGVIKNIFIDMDNNVFGTGSSVQYSAGLAARFDGTMSDVVLRMGVNNTFNGIVKSSFIGTLGANAQLSNAWVIVNEFSQEDIISNYPKGSSTSEVNSLSYAGNGSIGVKFSTQGNVTDIAFTFDVKTYTDENGLEISDGNAPYLAINDDAFGKTSIRDFSINANIDKLNKNDSKVINNNLRVIFAKIEIKNYEDLVDLATQINLGINYAGITYTLMDDIVIDGEFKPIGGIIGERVDGLRSVFSGIFDGNGFSITLTKDAYIIGDYAAIFGSIDQDAIIKNLVVKNQGKIGNEESYYSAILVANNTYERHNGDTVPVQIQDVVVFSIEGSKIMGSFSSAYVATNYESTTDNVLVIANNSEYNKDILNVDMTSGNDSIFEADNVGIITIIGGGNLEIVSENGAFFKNGTITLKRSDSVNEIVWYSNMEYIDNQVVTSGGITNGSSLGDVYSLSDDGLILTINAVENVRYAVDYLKRDLETAADMVKLSEDVSLGYDFFGITFNMRNDITIEGDPQNVFKPIGDSDSPFTATFNGNGNSIVLTNELRLDSYKYSGLFGYIAGTGKIENLRIVNDSVYIGGYYDNGIMSSYAATIAYNEGTIDTVVIETYGIYSDIPATDLSVSESLRIDYRAQANFAGGVSVSTSLNINNTWVVVATSNDMFAHALEETKEIRINKLTVIGRGTIISSIDNGSIVFTEKLLQRRTPGRDEVLKNWYYDFNKNATISPSLDGAAETNGKIETITMNAPTLNEDGSNSGNMYEYLLTQFTPNTELQNSQYEVSLIYLTLENVDDLNAIAYDVNIGGYNLFNKVFRLKNDIIVKAGQNIPIGLEGAKFQGTLDGQRYSIIYAEGNFGNSDANINPIFNLNSGIIANLGIKLGATSSNSEVYFEDKNGFTFIANENEGSISGIVIDINAFLFVIGGDGSFVVHTNRQSGEIDNVTINVNKSIEFEKVDGKLGDFGAIAINNYNTIDYANVSIFASITNANNLGGAVTNNYNILSNIVVNLFSQTVDASNVIYGKSNILSASNNIGGLVAENRALISSCVVFAYKENIRSDQGSKGIISAITNTKMTNTWGVVISSDTVPLPLSGVGSSDANILTISGSGAIVASAVDGIVLFTKNEAVTKDIYGWFDHDKKNIAYNQDKYGNVASDSYRPLYGIRGAIVAVEFIKSEIESVHDWNEVADYVNQGFSSAAVVFTLTRDLTFTNEFKMMGNEKNPFNYTLQGTGIGKTLTFASNFAVNSEKFAIFGALGEDAYITNINIEYDCNISDSYLQQFAGVALTSNAHALDKGIKNVNVTFKTGHTFSANQIAGYVLENNGYISASKLTIEDEVKLQGKSEAAGIAVTNSSYNIFKVTVMLGKNALISAISTTADRNYNARAAGLVVHNTGTINASYVEYDNATIRSNNDFGTSIASAFVIVNDGTISNSYVSHIQTNQNNYLVDAGVNTDSYASGFVVENNKIMQDSFAYVNQDKIRGNQNNIVLIRVPSNAQSLDSNSFRMSNIWGIVDNYQVQNSVKGINTFVMGDFNISNNTTAYYRPGSGIHPMNFTYNENANKLTFEFIASTREYDLTFFNKFISDSANKKAIYEDISLSNTTKQITYTPNTSEGIVVRAEYCRNISSADDYYAMAQFLNVFEFGQLISISLTGDITLDNKVLNILGTIATKTPFEFLSTGNQAIYTIELTGDRLDKSLFTSSESTIIKFVQFKINSEINASIVDTLNDSFIMTDILFDIMNMQGEYTGDGRLYVRNNNSILNSQVFYLIGKYEVCMENENALKDAYNWTNIKSVIIRGEGKFEHDFIREGGNSSLTYEVGDDTINGSIFLGYYQMNNVSTIGISAEELNENNITPVVIDYMDILLGTEDIAADTIIRDIWKVRYGALYSSDLPKAWLACFGDDDEVNFYKDNLAYKVINFGPSLENVNIVYTDIKVESMFLEFDTTDTVKHVADKGGDEGKQQVDVIGNKTQLPCDGQCNNACTYEFQRIITSISSARDFSIIVNSKSDYTGLTVNLVNSITIDDSHGTINRFNGTLTSNNGSIITLNNRTSFLIDTLCNDAIISNLNFSTTNKEFKIIKEIEQSPGLKNIFLYTGANESDFIIYKSNKADGNVVAEVLSGNIIKIAEKGETEEAETAGETRYHFTYSVNELSSVDDWNLFADSINNSDARYNDITISLTADIESTKDNKIKAIGTTRTMSGKIDGNYHTVKIGAADDGTNAIDGGTYLFGSTLTSVKVSNVTFEFATTHMNIIETNYGMFDKVTIKTLETNDEAQLLLWYKGTELLSDLTNDKSIVLNNASGARNRNLSYSVRINTIATSEEFMSFISKDSAYLNQKIELTNSFVIDLSSFGKAALLVNFAGTLSGQGNNITLNNIPVPASNKFTLSSNSSSSALMENILFIIGDENESVNNGVNFINTNDSNMEYSYVGLLARTEESINSVNNVGIFTIKGNGRYEVTKDNSNNFVVTTYPTRNIYGAEVNGVLVPKENTNLSSYSTSPYSAWAGVGKNTSDYELDARSYTIGTADMGNMFELYYELNYVVEAYSGNDTALYCFGVVPANGSILNIDVQNINKLTGFALTSAFGTTITQGTDNTFNVSVGDSDIKLTFTRLGVFGFSTTYTAYEQGFNENIIKNQLGDGFEMKYTYYEVKEGINVPMNVSKPKDAGHYIFKVVVKKDGIIVGASAYLPFEIQQANLFSSFSVQSKSYDGTTSIESNMFSKVANLLGTDSPGSILYDKLVVEYESSNAGQHRIKMAAGSSLTFSGIKANYKVETDSEGFLMINGKYVYGNINKKAYALAVQPITFEYSRNVSGSGIITLTTIDAINAANNAHCGTINVMGNIDSSKINIELRKEANIVEIDGVRYYAMIVVNRTVLQEAGTYVSKTQNEYATLYSVPVENTENYAELSMRTESIIINVSKIQLEIVFNNNIIEQYYGDRQADMRKLVTVTNKNGVDFTDSVDLRFTANYSDAVVGKYSVTLSLRSTSTGENYFELDNPNFELINTENQLVKEEAYHIVKRPLVVSSIDNMYRYFGLSGNTLRVYTQGNAKPLINANISAAVIHDGADVIKDTNIAVGSYQVTFTIRNKNGDDITSNYDISTKDDLYDYYEVREAKVSIIESSIEIIKILDDGKLKIRYNLREQEGSKLTLVDEEGNPRWFYAIVSAPTINEETGDYEEVELTVVDENGIENTNVSFGNNTTNINGDLISMNRTLFIDAISVGNYIYGKDEFTKDQKFVDYYIVEEDGTPMNNSVFATLTGYYLVDSNLTSYEFINDVNVLSRLPAGDYSIVFRFDIKDAYYTYVRFANTINSSDSIASITLANNGTTLELTTNPIVTINSRELRIEIGTHTITYGETFTFADVNSTIRYVDTGALVSGEEKQSVIEDINLQLSYRNTFGSNDILVETLPDSEECSNSPNYTIPYTNIAGMDSALTGSVTVNRRNITIAFRREVVVEIGEAIPTELTVTVGGQRLASGDRIIVTLNQQGVNDLTARRAKLDSVKFEDLYNDGFIDIVIRNGNTRVTANYSMSSITFDDEAILVINNEKTPLSPFLIIVIILGCLLLVAIIVLIILVIVKKSKDKKLSKIALDNEKLASEIGLEGEEILDSDTPVAMATDIVTGGEAVVVDDELSAGEGETQDETPEIAISEDARLLEEIDTSELESKVEDVAVPEKKSKKKDSPKKPAKPAKPKKAKKDETEKTLVEESPVSEESPISDVPSETTPVAEQIVSEGSAEQINDSASIEETPAIEETPVVEESVEDIIKDIEQTDSETAIDDELVVEDSKKKQTDDNDEEITEQNINFDDFDI